MFLFRLQNYIFFLFTAIFYSLFSNYLIFKYQTFASSENSVVKGVKKWSQMLIMLYQAKKQHSGIGQSLDWYGSETVPSTDTRKQRVLGCKPNQSSCSRFTQAIFHPPSCSSVLMSLKTMFLCPKKHVLLFSCLIPASNPHVLMSNYHAHFSCAN